MKSPAVQYEVLLVQTHYLTNELCRDSRSELYEQGGINKLIKGCQITAMETPAVLCSMAVT
jgi:hypothetical protein